MISNESSDSTSTSSGVHMNLTLAEAPDRPTTRIGGAVEGFVAGNMVGPRVPIVPIGLHDQAGLLEHEVGLEPTKHRPVHLELQPSLPKLVAKQAFDRGHVLRENLSQSRLAYLLSNFWTGKNLSYFLSCLSRVLMSKRVLIAKRIPACPSSTFGPQCGSPLLLAVFGIGPTFQSSLANSLSVLRCSLVNPYWHFMFNYNILPFGPRRGVR